MIPIRAMTLGDLPRVAELSSQLGYPVALDELRRRFDALSGASGNALFVGGDPVGGWIHVEARNSLEGGPNAEIVGLVVDATTRRSGIGRALVERARAFAVEHGLPKLRVRSNVTREESHRFYPALGFVRSKSQHVYELKLP